MERSWFISFAFGGTLLVAGLLMMRSHYRTWQRQKDDPDLDRAERAFLRRRYRRRMQASGMLVLIGAMLPVGDSINLFRRAPGWFAIYWTMVLFLVLWLVILAVSDLISTRTHAAVAMSRLKAQQRLLEREASVLRKQLSTDHNGEKSPGGETNGKDAASGGC